MPRGEKKHRINRSGKYVDVFKSGTTYTKIGQLYPNEIFACIDFLEGIHFMNIYFYSAKEGKMVYGFTDHSRQGISDGSFPYAYRNGYSYNGAGRFNVRRRTAVYIGTAFHTYLQAGDWVHTDGLSDCGQTYPERMWISGYTKAGSSIVKRSNMWADVGLEDNHSLAHDINVYGKW